ncbi:MAG TPA: hypothetical protein PKA63_07425 [Oligoflexia bacterium]|nr:hypothetical protein [Oligoflexia bacterium]HMP48480.1 hypothetical protein [Oligoflexia bacterium]
MEARDSEKFEMDAGKKLLAPFSCKEYTKLCSFSGDRPLGFWEKICHRFHHLCCFTCRRFSNQIGFINMACRHVIDGNSCSALPDEARARIEKKLKENLAQDPNLNE